MKLYARSADTYSGELPKDADSQIEVIPCNTERTKTVSLSTLGLDSSCSRCSKRSCRKVRRFGSRKTINLDSLRVPY